MQLNWSRVILKDLKYLLTWLNGLELRAHLPVETGTTNSHQQTAQREQIRGVLSPLLAGWF